MKAVTELFVVLLGIALCLAMWIAPIWIVCHFIVKYW